MVKKEEDGEAPAAGPPGNSLEAMAAQVAKGREADEAKIKQEIKAGGRSRMAKAADKGRVGCREGRGGSAKGREAYLKFMHNVMKDIMAFALGASPRPA